MDIRDDWNFKLVAERFPHIGLGIEIRWGTKDLEDYINDLFHDTKDHTRRGFPPDIGQALTFLLFLHDKEYPHCRKPPDSIWDINYLN